MKTITKHLIPNAGTLVIVGLLLLAQSVGATPGVAPAEPLALSPAVISYQGMLTDPDGTPVNETVTMEFALYDAASGGNLLWGPETQGVVVSEGLFHVLLGSVTPIDPATLTGSLYLDIMVNGETMSPREAIASAALAVMAQRSVAGFYVSGRVGIGTTDPSHALEVASGWASMEDHQIVNVRGLQLKDWDDDTGGKDNKYRLLARDGAWQFYNGGVVVGNYTDGTWSDLADGHLIVENKLAVGTTSPIAGTAVQINSAAVPLTLKESDQTGAGSLWRMPLDGRKLRFDASQNGTDFAGYITPLTLFSDGSIGCGALTEANLQTPEERAAGRIDRFEEGDVLCWAGDRLEKCSVANDRLVQAVADKSGRPIVIGAELVKVVGPVKEGDFLVASEVPGYAMATSSPAFGTVIAQALENFGPTAGQGPGGEKGIIKAMIRKL